MPKNKRLISKKLEQLEKLLNYIDEARVVNPDDSETWDSDILYDLEANCQKVIELLKDKLSPKEKDPFGEPLVLEAGLCSLVDDYLSEEEEEAEDW
jgi:hypothetical protein